MANYAYCKGTVGGLLVLVVCFTFPLYSLRWTSFYTTYVTPPIVVLAPASICSISLCGIRTDHTDLVVIVICVYIV